MKALQDFFRNNYIDTLVFFILKHEPCKKNFVVNPFFFLTMYVAVALLTFLENVLKNMHYVI